MIHTDIDLNSKVYYDIGEEEKIYTYKKQKAEELMYLQADSFYNGQKETL